MDLRRDGGVALGQRSTARPLALAYLALVVYASLYPFDAWRWPPGQTLADIARLPMPGWRDRFDEWINILGYLPLGLLLYAAVVRGGGTRARALAIAVLAPALQSWTMEVLQAFLPMRVPSVTDWMLNTLGAACGALLGAVAQAGGLFERWQSVRERWFATDSSIAMALLLLWPVALLVPAPVPFGLGQVTDELRRLAHALLMDTPWQIAPPPAPGVGSDGQLREGLGPLAEVAAVALGIMAPCLVAAAVTRAGWRRFGTVASVVVIGSAMTTLATALGFGPEHAGAWLTRASLLGIGIGAALSLLCAPAPERVLAVMGLVVLSSLVTLISMAPADPYVAASLTSWEQGRFIRFHGVARWLAGAWPFIAMGWLARQLVRRG